MFIKIYIICSYALLQAIDNAAAFTNATTTTADEQVYAAYESAKKLRPIYKLDEYCSKNHCSGLQYADSNEVAYFDLQTEVRIAADGETYDLGPMANYDTLIFENCTFNNFPLHLFKTLELSELDIRNCGIQNLSWDSFLMANKLLILLLADNQIVELHNMSFNYAHALQYLFVGNNQLQRLHAHTFKGLQHLRHLDLSNNRLEHLPVGVFADLHALQELRLDGNQLNAFASELLMHNKMLWSVTLHTNALHTIDEHAFREQTQLIALDLSHNQQLELLILNLQARFLLAANCSLYRVNLYGSVANVDLHDNHIMELYFAMPETLETLILHNNALQQIATLSHVPKLNYLNLADNARLYDLPMPWQADALTHLDLSNANLNVLPIAALANLSQLHTLNVSHNNLSEINPLHFKYLEKLTHFYIHANNWNCYNLNMLMNLLMRPFAITYATDNVQSDFPGEYIDGIACMYRLDEQLDDANAVATNAITTTNVNILHKQNLSLDPDPTLNEIKSLRKELKAIVGVYDQKFKQFAEMLHNLNVKIANIEKLNSTLWQHVTITV